MNVHGFHTANIPMRCLIYAHYHVIQGSWFNVFMATFDTVQVFQQILFDLLQWMLVPLVVYTINCLKVPIGKIQAYCYVHHETIQIFEKIDHYPLVYVFIDWFIYKYIQNHKYQTYSTILKTHVYNEFTIKSRAMPISKCTDEVHV